MTVIWRRRRRDEARLPGGDIWRAEARRRRVAARLVLAAAAHARTRAENCCQQAVRLIFRAGGQCTGVLVNFLDGAQLKEVAYLVLTLSPHQQGGRASRVLS